MKQILGVLLACAATLAAPPSIPLQPLKGIGGRIVNGQQADLGQFPWQVAIMARSQTIPRYLCGGALISDEWILTAGHCVQGALSATIYAGTTQLSSRNRTTSQAFQFILHDEFDPIFLRNDIGLIRLSQPITFDDNIKAIALAEEELEAGSNVTVSGWGQTSDIDVAPNSEVLNYIEVSTIDNRDCAAIYGAVVVNDGLVCTATGSPLKSPCLGDSGAPVVANAVEDPIHVGVFSFVNGLGCEFPYPAGNSRTAFYRDWIRNQTGI